MCLQKIKGFAFSMDDRVIAYKLVKKQGDVYYPELSPRAKQAAIGEGWSSDGLIVETYGSSPEAYEAGVHVFRDFLDACAYKDTWYGANPAYVIVEVECHGPICWGTKLGDTVMVYKEITILKETRCTYETLL